MKLRVKVRELQEASGRAAKVSPTRRSHIDEGALEIGLSYYVSALLYSKSKKASRKIRPRVELTIKKG